jgi:hypothetical protein
MRIIRIALVAYITIFSFSNCVKNKSQETSLSNNIFEKDVEIDLVNDAYDNKILNKIDVNDDSDINSIITYLFEDKKHINVDVSELEEYYYYNQNPDITTDHTVVVKATLNDNNVNIRKFPSVMSKQLGQISISDLGPGDIYVENKSDCLINIDNVNYRWYYCFFVGNAGKYSGYGWICGKYIDIENENAIPELITIKINGIDQHPVYYFSDFPCGIVKENLYKDIIIKALLSRVTQEEVMFPNFNEDVVIYDVKNITDMDLFHVKMIEKIFGISSSTERNFPNYNILEFGSFQEENGERSVIKMIFENNMLKNFLIDSL